MAGDPEPENQETRRSQIAAALNQAGLTSVDDLVHDGAHPVDVAAAREMARKATEFWDYSTEMTRVNIWTEFPEIFDTTEVRPSSGWIDGNRVRLNREHDELHSRRRGLDAAEHARLMELKAIQQVLQDVDNRAEAMRMPVHLVSYPATGDTAKALVVEIGDRKAAAGHQVWFVPRDAADYGALNESVDEFTDLAEAENVPGRATSIIGVLRYGGAADADVAASTESVAEGLVHRITFSQVAHELRAPYQSPPTVEIVHRGDGSAVWAAVADRLRDGGVDPEPVLVRAEQWVRALPGAPELQMRSRQPEVVAAIGDPSTADHVVVLLDAQNMAESLRTGLRDAVGRYATEHQAHPDETTAVVVVQGGDPSRVAGVLAGLAEQRAAAGRIRLRGERGLLKTVLADERLTQHRDAFTREPGKGRQFIETARKLVAEGPFRRGAQSVTNPVTLGAPGPGASLRR